MKDPAFLFYPRDFYVTTRLMTPEERAAFIDLLIYQHLYGEIPKDLTRVKLFATGINEQVLKQVLEQKFNKTPTGYINEFLAGLQESRQEFSEKRKSAGKFSVFWRYLRKQLSTDDYEKAKKAIYENNCIDKISKKLNKQKTINNTFLNNLFKHVLSKCLNNVYIYANANANANANEIANANNNQGKRGIVKGEKGKKATKSPCAEICSPKLAAKWQEWKNYKAAEFGFEYKSAVSEKTAINKLLKLAAGKDETAIAIIEQSIANGWKGFFQLNQPAEKPREKGPKNFGVEKDAERAKKLLEKLGNK